MKTILIAFLTLLVLATTLEAQTYNEPLFSRQWGLKNVGQPIVKSISDLEREVVYGQNGIDVNWFETFSLPVVKREVVVAVIDSGIDLNHPELKNKIWYNRTLCENAPNAKNLPCNGFNFLENNNILVDDIGHGTHVAGIIAAEKNGSGIVGVSDPRVKIMPLKVLNQEVASFVYKGKLITDIIADAMNFAVKNGADVINLSLGFPKLIDTPKIRLAFENAYKANVVVIAASGNNNKDLPTFPCSYENVICVGAIDNTGKLTDFSNHGAKVDLVAPGESIVSTFPELLESRVLRIKNYENKRGSSQASPFVAGIVASLKLFYPEFSADKIKSLLLRSSREMTFEETKSFVNHGLVDMRNLFRMAALEKENDVFFVTPEIKNLTQVLYSKDTKKFNFSLPLKNLSNLSAVESVCLTTKTTSVKLNGPECFPVEFKSLEKKEIQISGELQNLAADSHVLFELKIGTKKQLISIVFSRDLNNDSEVETYKIGPAPFEEMALVNGDRRVSRLFKVFDKHQKMGFPEYFFQQRSKQTDKKTIVTVLTYLNNQFTLKDLAIDKVNRVLSIHRQDINLDGLQDYFLYTLSDKKDELVFYLFNHLGEPLFSNNYSTWHFPLSTFEGLPIDGGLEKFEWVKIKNQLMGEILVPSIYRSFKMPEADNSKRIGDRVVDTIPHQFYFNPTKDKERVVIELRVLDSVVKMKELRKKLGLLGQYDVKSINVLRPLPQTELDYRQGVIRSLAVMSNFEARKYYEIKWPTPNSSESITLSEIKTDRAIDQTIPYSVIATRDSKTTDEVAFTALTNRSTAEFFIKKGDSTSEPFYLKESWENPIINLLGVFDDTFLLETRYHVVSFDKKGEKRFELPIYRDSSFPGQNFSETITPVIVDQSPGLFVNSTLIYGERLYSMLSLENNFLRPLTLSVAIPAGCVPLMPDILGQKREQKYFFLCLEANKEVAVKTLPLTLL